MEFVRELGSKLAAVAVLVVLAFAMIVFGAPVIVDWFAGGASTSSTGR